MRTCAYGGPRISISSLLYRPLHLSATQGSGRTRVEQRQGKNRVARSAPFLSCAIPIYGEPVVATKPDSASCSYIHRGTISFVAMTKPTLRRRWYQVGNIKQGKNIRTTLTKG